MLSELPRVITATVCMAIILWHSGVYARQFGWDAARKAFLLRYSAQVKGPRHQR